MWWIGLASAASGAAPPTCGTLRALAEAPPPASAPVLGFGGSEKALRDPYGTPNLQLSPNFVVRWGDGGGVTTAEVDRLLGAFERAWELQLVEMGHLPPYGTEAFRFNVYVGDSGDGAPPGYGAGGYYTLDPEGWPVIVVSAASLNDPFYADHTAIHEFYHALQGATGRYTYDGAAAWFWESSAEWAAIATDPGNPTNGPFLFSYALLPQLPVNFFDYPDSGSLQEYYQYGSFVFPLHLADRHGYEVIRDAWVVEGPDDDPLEVMRAWIAGRGGDLDEDWLDHLARNVGWDYPGGEDWQDAIDAVEPFFPEGEPITVRLTGAGTEGPQEVRGELAPRRYGHAVIRLRDPDEGQLTVRITGDAAGGQGSPARYGARLVRVKTDGATEILAVPFDGVEGSLDVPDVGAEDDQLWLLVGAWTEDWLAALWLEEKFPFSFELSIAPPPEPEPEPADPTEGEEAPRACACAPTAAPGAAGWLLVPLLAYWPRRASSSASTR